MRFAPLTKSYTGFGILKLIMAGLQIRLSQKASVSPVRNQSPKSQPQVRATPAYGNFRRELAHRPLRRQLSQQLTRASVQQRLGNLNAQCVRVASVASALRAHHLPADVPHQALQKQNIITALSQCRDRHLAAAA